MRTAVFSIISPNYRHYARVLMASVQRHHHEWERFVLLIGETAPSHLDEAAFTTVPLDALALPNPRQFCFRYTILELDTAVKPWMFAYLFERGYDRVVYLDPDIFVYSPLVELDALPPETFLTLTPHLTGFIGGDEEHPSERSILIAGTYNLGFLAVSRRPSLHPFLEWWQGKLEHQCVVETARGLFVDQKWIDLVPGLFPGVSILRYEGYNVAYWNLGQRRVVAETGGVSVNGQPLRFFHFSGVDPASPELVSKYDSKQTHVDVGDASGLIEDYCAALRAAGYETFKHAPYAFGFFSDGSPVHDSARVAYRSSKAIQASCGPDPFQHAELFIGYRGVVRRSRATARLGVASYRLLSGAKPLVRLIPGHLRIAVRELLLGRSEGKQTRLRASAAGDPGLNIVGYIGRDSGVGESARLCRKACDAAGLRSHLIDVDRSGGLTQEAFHNASIYHVNADQLPVVRDQFARVFDASGYNIGCWHWELPELPDEWLSMAASLDEIWAPSAFIQSAISRKLRIPVVHMPHGIEISTIEACSPEELGVPRGRFTFLCTFDLASVVQRKNPLAAVEAFRRAFPHESQAALLIKTSYADDYRAEYAEFEQQLRGIPGVYLTDQLLSRARVNGLLASCDSVVSLHRSEGFGLILAEAMSLGKAVVATGWSGNMDFMDSGNSCPVGYRLVTLDRTYEPYKAGAQWAEPDVEHAADLMRRVVEDTSLARKLGDRARETIRLRFSPNATGLRYRQRLALLGLLEGEKRKTV